MKHKEPAVQDASPAALAHQAATITHWSNVSHMNSEMWVSLSIAETIKSLINSPVRGHIAEASLIRIAEFLNCWSEEMWLLLRLRFQRLEPKWLVQILRSITDLGY